jgi:hypothetical protein
MSTAARSVIPDSHPNSHPNPCLDWAPRGSEGRGKSPLVADDCSHIAIDGILHHKLDNNSSLSLIFSFGGWQSLTCTVPSDGGAII